MDLCRNALLQRVHMTDNAYSPALSLQIFQSVDGNIERRAIKRTKAFINKKRINERIAPLQRG